MLPLQGSDLPQAVGVPLSDWFPLRLKEPSAMELERVCRKCGKHCVSGQEYCPGCGCELPTPTPMTSLSRASYFERPYRKASERVITAKSLVLLFMSLRRLVPDLSSWSEEKLCSDPRLLLRLRQVISMCRAYGISLNPKAFVDGAFLDVASLADPRYAAVRDRVVETLKRSPHFHPHDGNREPPVPSPRMLFAELFAYRSALHNVLSYYECDFHDFSYVQAYVDTLAMNEAVGVVGNALDGLLADLISPERTVFTVDELAQRFGYPDVDIRDVDGEHY